MSDMLIRRLKQIFLYYMYGGDQLELYHQFSPAELDIEGAVFGTFRERFHIPQQQRPAHWNIPVELSTVPENTKKRPRSESSSSTQSARSRPNPLMANLVTDPRVRQGPNRPFNTPAQARLAKKKDG